MARITAATLLAGTLFTAIAAEPRLEDLQGRAVRLSDVWKRGSTAVVVLPARARPDCKANIHCTSPDVPVTFLFSASRQAAELIDTSEKVRRTFKDGALDDILHGAADWVRGQRAYEGQCSRCHGFDGADVSYPNIRPLAGIGERYSIEEIMTRMTKTGNVDLSSFSEDAKRALANYVASL